jgi:hypothetical protein
MDYNLIWLILGLSGIFIVSATITLIFWFTRHKPIKTIKTLPVLTPQPVDLSALKTKYFSLIDELLVSYNTRTIKSSTAHQRLSLLARFFVFEASGFRAHILTLSDLQKARREHLTQLITLYYPPEFDGLEQGSVQHAADLAKKLIGEWQ